MTNAADRSHLESGTGGAGSEAETLFDHLAPDDRIIEIDPPDTALARALAERGRSRYLALGRPEAIARLRREAPDLAVRFQPRPEPLELRTLSADVVALRGDATRLAWVIGEIRQVRSFLIAWNSVEPRLVVHLRRLARRLSPGPSGRLAGTELRIFERPGHRPGVHPRVHLSPAVGYEGLFGKFTDRGLQPVVLRWFEALPELPPGEDLDILVSDEEIDSVRAVITEEPGILPIDIYSVTGLPGSDREGVACYPPALADSILKRSRVHRSGARVPHPEDHLHALAYHVLYHKGAEGGLPSGLLEAEGPAEHDYVTILRELGAELGIEIPLDMEALDEYLAGIGWRPPMDTLRKLSLHNRWVEERFFSRREGPGEVPQTSVFVLRSRALETISLDEVESELRHLGFEIVERRRLDPEAAERCRNEMRGGNWGPGPYPTSGGPPHTVLVTLHYGPEMPGEESRKAYPHLTNVHVLTAKNSLRDLVNDRLPQDRHCNVVHSSDNEEEAWEYVRAALPDRLSSLEALVRERRATFFDGPPALDVLAHGRRARVEVVEWEGRKAVRKTFGWGFRTHLEREIEADRAFAGHPGVVPALAHGDNWIVRPLIEDRLGYDEDNPVLVPLELLRDMVEILRSLHEAGYALIDANPENFVMDSDGLKLIDFEFLHRYDGEVPPFHESYSWHGPPSDLDIDRPVGPISYRHRWLPWTGLPVEALCYGSLSAQRRLRMKYRITSRLRGGARMVVRGLPLAGRSLLRSARGSLRSGLGKGYHGVARRRAGIVR